MAIRLIVLLVFSFFVSTGFSDAFAAEEQARPRVALVLGGGGAHALANLGVIRELERQRVPIDLVVGTGLGGVLGGLYASGKTPDEIQAFFLETNWQDVFDPDTSREDLSFRRKRDDDDFLIKYRVGIKDGQAQLPTALVPNDKLARLLQATVANTKEVTSFDKLPIAFRSVAMDMLTGDEVILDSGSLDRAMLASLSAPGTLPPVEIGGRLLLTGGLINNLAVDVAHDWGADIVIVANVDPYRRTADDLNSVFDVVDQVAHLLQQRNSADTLANLAPSDILVSPAVGVARETDFSSMEHWIDQGEQAAIDVSDRLSALRISDAEFVAVLANRNMRISADLVISDIRLVNETQVDDSQILALIQQRPGSPLDKQQLDADIRRIYGIGAFGSVDFKLLEQNDGAVLELYTTENRSGNRFWRFGISLEDDLQGNSAYTGSASMTWTQLNRLGAEWRNVFRIGERQQLATEFYQPIDKSGKYFFSAIGSFIERNVNAIDEGDITNQARIREATGVVSIGRVIGNSSELRLSMNRGEGETRVNIGDDSPRQDFSLGGISVSAISDTYDNVYFPKRGHSASLVWSSQRESMGSSIDVDIGAGNLSVVRSWGSHSMLAGIRVESQLDDAEGVQNLVLGGGLFRLSGFQRDELSGRHSAMGRLIYYRQIRSNPLRGLLNASFYIGASAELGNVWQNSDDVSFDNTLAAGSLFVGADTFIGPVYLAGGLAEGGNSAMYLYIGRPF